MQGLIAATGIHGIETEQDIPGEYEKIFLLIGYPIPNNPNNPGNHPHEPMKKHIVEYFADDLGVAPDFDSFILQRTEFPLERNDFITMQTTTGWSKYKNWDEENWNKLCWMLQREKIKVIQVGGPYDQQLPYAYTKIKGGDAAKVFNTCLVAMANARLHIGVDSWANHATNIKWYDVGSTTHRKTPGIILWGSSQASATGYIQNLNLSKNLPCSPCFKEDPRVSTEDLGLCEHPPGQTYEEPKHECMSLITVDEVFEAVTKMWKERANDF